VHIGRYALLFVARHANESKRRRNFGEGWAKWAWRIGRHQRSLWRSWRTGRPRRDARTRPRQLETFLSYIDEIRGGVFYDKHREETGILASPEALSSQLPFYNGNNPFLAALLKPRLVAGAMVSVEGRISYAYTGVNWRVPIYDRLFAEVEFGGALNDSEKGQPGWLGCPVTFRESGGLGFQIISNIDIVGSIEHVSHAELCGRTNPGLSSFGLRLGYTF
jgi:lipid A 3-O-deacylase